MQEANFASRTALVPAESFLAARGSEWEMLCAARYADTLVGHTIPVVWREFKWEGPVGSEIKQPSNTLWGLSACAARIMTASLTKLMASGCAGLVADPTTSLTMSSCCSSRGTTASPLKLSTARSSSSIRWAQAIESPLSIRSRSCANFTRAIKRIDASDGCRKRVDLGAPRPRCIISYQTCRTQSCSRRP